MWSRNRGGITLALAALVVLTTGLALALLWAPEDADQGPSQRIFYLHVPIALTAYACFGWAAWKALRLLWTGDARRDLESYTAVHMGTIFGTLTLVTGSIWAKTSWGLVELGRAPAGALPGAFPLLRRLLHAALLAAGGAGPHLGGLRPVRRRADPDLVPGDPARRELHHPSGRVHADGPQMSDDMFFTFCVASPGCCCSPRRLSNELAGKRLDAAARATGGTRVSDGETYLAAAYVVFSARCSRTS